MIDITDIEVSTALNSGDQLLKVESDIGTDQTESFFFRRPLGTNTWFFLAGRGRKGDIDRDANSTPQVIDNLEQELVDQGWPIRPINNSSNTPTTGSVEVQFSGTTFHRYPLFSDDASVVVAKKGDIDDAEVDAMVEVKYSNEEYEYVVHVSDGDLPDDWVLEDLVIWADAIELGDTYHAHENLRNPESITVSR
ncbi:hypothetical protein [Halobacterium sp. KA-6]|uniref:hypothetical protein n=1 Tax=Halobacterium sp. KA-6 TaxID=2896368 RepID=UPI001E5AC4A3|nr:hypothetical protein [Halobacterium sp. KA-6]MCD2205144.1 hypothetical protein [Halobacterium sp. KA-6]